MLVGILGDINSPRLDEDGSEKRRTRDFDFLAYVSAQLQRP